jgi:MarR family transcriptional regulator, negative regulator of the multidrug operon emrRAB
MHDVDRTANLLGATALAVTDLMVSGATAAAGVSASGAAALVVLASTPGLGVTELGRRVGLSQSAAARMVDSLVAADLVRREGRPGRSVSVRPTARGTRTAARLLAARGEPLADLVAALDDRDREALERLLPTLLAALHARVGSTELVCRLCDRTACTARATCPVGEAGRRAGS